MLRKLEYFEKELNASPTGREILAVVRTHMDEVSELVNRNRSRGSATRGRVSYGKRIYYAHMSSARSPRKVATNLSVRADLVRRARKLGLNISQVVDAALEMAVKEGEDRAWLDENRSAIDEYNALVAKRGVFSDGRRRF